MTLDIEMVGNQIVEVATYPKNYVIYPETINKRMPPSFNFFLRIHVEQPHSMRSFTLDIANGNVGVSVREDVIYVGTGPAHTFSMARRRPQSVGAAFDLAACWINNNNAHATHDQ